jgi:hypothetical protein
LFTNKNAVEELGQGQEVRQVKAWSPVRQQVPTLQSTSLAQLPSSRARPRHRPATQLLDWQSEPLVQMPPLGFLSAPAATQAPMKQAPDWH